MDPKLLEQANKINEEIQKISDFLRRMDSDFGSLNSINREYYFPQPLKDLLRPVLQEYQEKLFKELKNL